MLKNERITSFFQRDIIFYAVGQSTAAFRRGLMMR